MIRTDRKYCVMDDSDNIVWHCYKLFADVKWLRTVETTEEGEYSEYTDGKTTQTLRDDMVAEVYQTIDMTEGVDDE
jgi:hypothetical protein